jgi:hypothetical protein
MWVPGGHTGGVSMESPEHVLERNITALNARDLDAYLANQSPDVEFVLPGVPSSGAASKRPSTRRRRGRHFRTARSRSEIRSSATTRRRPSSSSRALTVAR